MRTGKSTSEFKVTIAACAVVGLLAAFGIKMDIATATAFVAPIVAYAISRGMTKKGQGAT